MANLKELEDSLKSFLIDVQSDAHNIKTLATSRYNNLKITMAPIKIKTPHVTIRMGMSEATYTLGSWEKINGGLGFEERFIHRWFERSGIKSKLDECWQSERDRA